MAEQDYERQGDCCLRRGQQLLATLEELTLASGSKRVNEKSSSKTGNRVNFE